MKDQEPDSQKLSRIKDHLSALLALVVSVALLASALYNYAWWGDRAVGAMIGAAVVALLIILLTIFGDRASSGVDKFVPWVLISFGAVTALLLRSSAGRGPAAPVQIQMPSAAQLQAIFLILLVVLLFTLIGVFVRAVGRGEGVSVESHWGGLGGGLGGFQVSPPMIYLLGIMLLLTISSAVAWRAYAPPDKEDAQKTQRQQAAAPRDGSDAAQPADSPSPAAQPTPSQSASPQP
jgi:hypothetical protein